MKKYGLALFSLSILLNGCSTLNTEEAISQSSSKVEVQAEEMSENGKTGLNLEAVEKGAELVDAIAGTNYKDTVEAVQTAVQVAEDIKATVDTFTGQNTANGRIQATVTKVKDGDTIEVRMNGKKETVRFLLTDTPESVKPGVEPQPFSTEASNFVKKMLTGKRVELEKDIGDARDKYGRLLYYVYVDGKSVQEELLKRGFARVAYVYPPNVKYVDKYRSIQKEAQKAKIGIWSVENYVQKDGYHPEVMK